MLRIGNRAIPTWLLVAALTVAGAGAAVGTILAGNITGEMPVTVGRALVIDEVKITGLDNYRTFTSVSADRTHFTAAAEVATGMSYPIKIELVNKSNQDLVAELILDFPEGITIEVTGPSGNSARVTNVTRTGLYNWKMNVKAGANGHATYDVIKVTVAVADDIKPGFYEIKGTLTQVAY